MLHLQHMVAQMKKNETQGGYEFPNVQYYRNMLVLQKDYASVEELVEKIVMCSFIINRKGGDYGERSSDDDERVAKKRKSE